MLLLESMTQTGSLVRLTSSGQFAGNDTRRNTNTLAAFSKTLLISITSLRITYIGQRCDNHSHDISNNVSTSLSSCEISLSVFTVS